ncbi:MAG TPA: DNA translocase FtsK 4TM domain-containing protein [bacterium]|nr:DNA translocase FtsK 4TM domain-containing protein [bacterium]
MASDKRHHFLIVFLAGSAALLMALSLIPTGEKPNLLGNVGSHTAFFLYSGFGLWAWIFPLVFLRFAIARFTDDPLNQPGLKIVGLVLGLVSLCVITRVLAPGVQMFSAAQMREGVEWGGKLGALVGDPMESVLTRFGTGVVCLLVLVLSAWFLEKEEHLVTAVRRAWEGLSRGAQWFGEHGFEAFALLGEKARKSIADWKARRGEKRAADQARQKLASQEKIFKGNVEDEAPLPPKPPVKVAPAPTSLRPEKPAKSKALFTGDAEESLDKLGADPVKPVVEEEEDVVTAAMAEAKGGDPMTLKQKMEAASIEMAEEEEEAAEPAKPARVIRQWQLPTVHILKSAEESKDKVADDFEGVSRTLKETLTNFGVDANVVGVNPGPTVTQYEVQPAAGVKITRIVSLADDLALALKCGQVRVVAPIPGKATVGIEVPNSKGRVVTLKELIASDSFLNSHKKLLVALGKDIPGDACNASIKEMPHVLIAGSTGSGKSVCVNTLIASLLFKLSPEELRLVLVDPKRVEMAIYKGLPHLALPVVNDPKEAHLALKWLVREMEERYELLAHVGARDIDSYNTKILQKREAGETEAYPMYYIVVLVDELADLMMVAKDQVEDSITRLAQMARAVGIHLVLATQRPSVEVITGIIKANFPSRIAFQVFSKVDSRTILDMNGAEALLGRGDMLYLASGAPKPLRLQGAYVSTEEIERLVDFWTSQGVPMYSADLTTSKSKDIVTEESEDELYESAKEIVIRAKQASTSLLQRRLKIGYGRAARLLDDMEVRGIVGPADGNKPRKILVQTGGGNDGAFEGDEEELDEKMD